MAQILTGPDRAAALLGLPGWSECLDQDAITKQFQFADFSTAFAFMTQVALAAERINHHPDWSNAYNRVDIRLSTHDAGGLTELDIGLARAIDVAAKRGSPAGRA